jgi:hypothetical protein
VTFVGLGLGHSRVVGHPGHVLSPYTLSAHRREQNRYNFNGKPDRSSVYERPNMNQFRYIVNQIGLIIVKEEKIVKKTHETQETQETHIWPLVSLCFSSP